MSIVVPKWTKSSVVSHTGLGFYAQLQDEHGECRNQEQEYEKCSHLQNSHRRVVSTDKSLLVKLDDCIWYHTQDTCKDDYGDAVTNTMCGNLLPQPHQECGACCKYKCNQQI